jgi:hypothetical protein
MPSLIKIHSLEDELLYVAGLTDRHEEANSPFPQVCERA